jgi:abelson tyrosine-protein kinase 1
MSSSRSDCHHLVVGSLEAPDYGMFVSHKCPDGQAHFDVFNDRKPGTRWGEFTVDHSDPNRGSFVADASWIEKNQGKGAEKVCSQRCSTNGESGKGWNSLILARLRFRPDEDDPTSQ